MKRSVLVFVIIFSFLFAPIRNAKAASVGDAILTVSIATAAGAVLGLSTLPFYQESGDHLRNIFYGAAFGAVAGVLIMSYAGFQDTADASGDEANLRKDNQHELARDAKNYEWKRPNDPGVIPMDTLVYTNLYGARF
jgi:hypothetical protein